MSERSGIALNAGDSGWPVGGTLEPGPKKDGTGADANPKALAVANGVVTATETWVRLDPAAGGTTFTVTVAGQTTTAIARNATGATIQTALEALSNVAPGDVNVTGPAGGPWDIEFLEAGAFGDSAPVVTGVGTGFNLTVTQESAGS